jgi:dephospho-CoA kinase
MRRIGLTGGIGSGKSTVAALLVAEGAVLVDTDAIVQK